MSISGSIERRLSVCSSAPAPLMAVRKSCAIAKAESPGEGPSELLFRPPITHQPKGHRRARLGLAIGLVLGLMEGCYAEPMLRRSDTGQDAVLL